MASQTGQVSVVWINGAHAKRDQVASLLARTSWKWKACSEVEAAITLTGQGSIGVILCSADDSDSWRELLSRLSALPEPPAAVFFSRLADERLWAEMLNLGAYDLLAEPLVAEEFYQVISAAWRHWDNGRGGKIVRRGLAVAGVSAPKSRGAY